VLALRMLNRRDYSCAELAGRLADRNIEADRVEAVIKRCLDLGYLDDQRYAAQRARSLMRQGRAVGRRILLDLRRHGIDEATAVQALQQARDEQSDSDVLDELLERRFSGFDYTASTEKERRRIIHYLQRRGFALECILEKLTEKG